MKKCRVCNSSSIKTLGNYRPYKDYECMLYECDSCESRFTDFPALSDERIKNARVSIYQDNDVLARRLKKYFDQKNAVLAKEVLSEVPKFRFVMNTIEARSDIRRVLELGCSYGHLTSYFLIKQYAITGVDVYPELVEAANRLFGDHFFVYDREKIRSAAPYDAIFHVGTIGCVEFPLKFTNFLITLLKPGGILIFNSPNVAACKEINEIWIHEGTPPDLVTLFQNSFWNKHFGDQVDTELIGCPADGCTSLKILLKKSLGLKHMRTESGYLFKQNPKLLRHAALRLWEGLGGVRSLVDKAGRAGLWPKKTSAFDNYVIMTKK